MADEGDKLDQLLHADLKVDRLLDRLENVETLTRIIHDGRVRNARSAEIAFAIVKFLKEG
jgi:hypothetical protein